MFHIRKNGKIKINSEYKYWEFIAFLSEHSSSFDYWSLDYPTCKEMAIGFRRYKINRKRHERQNSRFMQTYKWMQQQRQESEEEKMTQFDKMCEVLGIQMDKETKAEILAGDLELVLIWNEEDGSLTDWGCN